jgi:hypothetical protein
MVAIVAHHKDMTGLDDRAPRSARKRAIVF